MKKFVKPLIIAASVAAVAGIGAVSFAKWEATASTQTAEKTGNSLGTVEFVSFDSTTPVTAAVTGLKPYDQDRATAGATTGTTQYGTFTLKFTADTSIASFDLKVTADNFQKDGSAKALASGSKLYIDAEIGANDQNPSDWIEINGTNTITLTKPDSGWPATTDVYIFLDSDAADDMAITFDVTFDIQNVTYTA